MPPQIFFFLFIKTKKYYLNFFLFFNLKRIFPKELRFGLQVKRKIISYYKATTTITPFFFFKYDLFTTNKQDRNLYYKIHFNLKKRMEVVVFGLSKYD